MMGLNKHNYIILLLYLSAVWGCSNNRDGSAGDNNTFNSGMPEPEYQIGFEESLRFGSTDEQLIGVRGWGNVITDQQNRVYIPDYRSNEIHVFDESGVYITQMGGRGRGPGMYLHLAGIHVNPEYLFLYDMTLLRINVYSLKDHKFSHTIELGDSIWGHIEILSNRTFVFSGFYVTEDGRMLMLFSYSLWRINPELATIQFYWVDQNWKVIDGKVVEMKARERIERSAESFFSSTEILKFDFLGKPLHTMSRNGIIATAQNKEFNITIYTSEGNVKNTIVYPFEKIPLEHKKLHELSNAYKSIDLPEYWPALETLMFDDQERLWVAAIVPDFSVHQWYIFNVDGELLAQFTWPRNKTVQHVNNQYMYTSETDEIGDRVIVRYSINMDKMYDL